jgi:Zn-dependent peptidase ImmA (M78 family)
MSIEHIYDEAARIIKKYDETDPIELARAMKIILLYEAMGDYDEACKGFYLYQSRKKIITINSDLPRMIQRIILAHEIGHAVLHPQAARLHPFHDFSLYDSSSRYEYEANLFAAEYLLKDESVFEALNDDKFFFAAARELCVPAELLDFKFRILKRKGYKIIDPPLMANSDFLKNINN